jgi:hypothetical protein
VTANYAGQYGQVQCAWPDLREECANLQHMKNSHEERIAQLEAQVGDAIMAIRRIDAINDNPACFNAEIDEVCRPFIRQGS